MPLARREASASNANGFSFLLKHLRRCGRFLRSSGEATTAAAAAMNLGCHHDQPCQPWSLLALSKTAQPSLFFSPPSDCEWLPPGRIQPPAPQAPSAPAAEQRAQRSPPDLHTGYYEHHPTVAQSSIGADCTSTHNRSVCLSDTFHKLRSGRV